MSLVSYLSPALLGLAIAVLNTIKGGYEPTAKADAHLKNIYNALNPIVTVLALFSWFLLGSTINTV